MPRAGWWFGRSKHWAIWFLTGSWDYFGELREGTYVELSQEDACDIAGGVWVGGRCEMLDCPLLISTEGDKVKLTSAEHGVQFDLNADGIAERIAWTRRDADDAWLAMDRNGNGVIDDGSELFGTATPAFGDRAEPTTAHGFAALQFLENPSYGASRADGVIDAADSAYSRLLLWIDRNHNGFSEDDELQRVPESNLIALFTEHRESRKRDRHGNEFRLRGRTRWQTGQGVARREQTLRPEGEHPRHEQVDQHRSERRPGGIGDAAFGQLTQQQRQIGSADRIDDADDQGAVEGAADRSDPADDDHDQHDDQDMVAHARLYRENGRGHQPRKAGKRSADPEQQRIEQAYVDAKHRHHARIAGAGANEHSDPRVMDDDIEPERDERARQ